MMCLIDFRPFLSHAEKPISKNTWIIIFTNQLSSSIPALVGTILSYASQFGNSTKGRYNLRFERKGKSMFLINN